ncbi:MAG: phage tail tube protein [Pigmentiphaga sp.]
MARYARQRGYIGLGAQAAKGTGVVPTTFLRYQGTPSMTPEIAFERYQEGGDSQYPGFTHKRMWRPDGNFDAFLRPDSGAMLLAHLLGKEITTGTDTDPVVSTTLTEGEPAGETNLVVASVDGFSVDDVIQIGTAAGGAAECRVIESINAGTNTLVVTNGLKNSYGAATEVAKKQAPYSHILMPGDYGDMTWLSIERSIADQIVERMIDCRIASVQLVGEAGLPLRVTVNYLGITSQKLAAAQTPTYETEMPFVFHQGSYTEDAVDRSGSFRSFNLTIQNVFDEDDQANQLTRADIPLIRRDITGSWVYRMENGDPYESAYYDGASGDPLTGMYEGSLELVQSYGSGTGVRSITVNIPKVVHTVRAIELSADSEAAQEYACEGHAEKDASEEFVTVTIQNGVSAEYV